jgi:hypothetical protein
MSRGRQGFVRLAAVAALGLTCLAAAACSGPQDPLVGLTAKQVLMQAMANFKAAPSLTIDGLISGPAAADNAPAAPGVTLEGLVRGPVVNSTVHLGIVRGKGCTGAVETLAKGSITFIAAGQENYLKPDGAWWDTIAGSGGTGISQLIGDRYLKESAAESGQSLTDTCDLIPLAGLGTSIGTVIKGQVTTLNGIRVLPLNGAHDDVLYVTDTTKPEIAGIFQPEPDGDGDYGNITVRVGAPVALAPPPPAQAVDASDFDLAGDGSSSASLGSAILAHAYANLEAAPTMTLTSTLNDAVRGYPVDDVDLGFRAGQGCAGTVDYGSNGSIKLVVIDGAVYYAPDAAYWAALGGANAQASENLFNGRYVEVPENDITGNGKVGALCDISNDIGPLPLTGSPTVGKVTTLDGVRVLPLTEPDGAVVYVSDTGRLQIVQITDPQQAGSDQPFGTTTFKVGTPVALTPPPPSQVFEGSTVGL